MTKARDGLARLRAWWLERQGLAVATAPKDIAACLRQAGWLSTAGSMGPYLSIRARMPGLSRDAIDRAAIDGVDIIEVPGPHARPPVLVPRDEMALALRLHKATYDKHVAPVFASGRVSAKALDAVASQACRALDEGPLSTGDIRAAITHPDAAELLTGALVGLTVRGVLRRYPSDGRLDGSKYVYELRHPDDRPDLDAEGDAEAVVAKAVRLFLKRHGPATVDEVVWWGGLTKRAIRTALATLGAEPVSLPGWADETWLTPEDRRAWSAFEPGARDRVVLLPYRDPLVSARRPPAVLAGRGGVRVLNPDLRSVALRDVNGLTHHSVLVSGELVGIWEYDPESRQVLTRTWGVDKSVGARVAEAAADTGRFIRQQLGDMKLSAVDPPERRVKRLAFVKG